MSKLMIWLFLVATAAGGAAELRMVHHPAPVDSGWLLPQTEPRVAVNPKDASHAVIAAILAPATDDDPWDCGVTTTRDGGKSWQSHVFGIDRCIDPWVVFAGDTVLFNAIEIAREGEGDERLTLVLARSADGGINWSGTRTVGAGFEHPMGLVHEGTAYLLSRRTRATRDGHPRHEIELAHINTSTLEYSIMHTLRPGNVQLTPTALVAHQGQLLAFWYDYGRNLNGFGAEGQFERSRAWVGMALPGADTPAMDTVQRLIHGQCGGQTNRQSLFAGYPYAVAGSGWLYHLCIGPHLDGVLISRSRDGESWTAPQRLNGPSPGSALTPMLAANDQGGVVAAWQDRRQDPDCQVFTIAVSLDSGQSFSAPSPMGSASCPQTDANGRAGRSWPGGGDYSAFALDSSGQFHLAWAQVIRGRYHLMYAVAVVD